MSGDGLSVSGGVCACVFVVLLNLMPVLLSWLYVCEVYLYLWFIAPPVIECVHRIVQTFYYRIFYCSTAALMSMVSFYESTSYENAHDANFCNQSCLFIQNIRLRTNYLKR